MKKSNNKKPPLTPHGEALRGMAERSRSFVEMVKRNAPRTNTMNIILKASSLDVVFAGEWREFFYEESNECVNEGDPVGLDCWDEKGTNCELVLFNNIYWSGENED
jgi:hypothetical protein